MIFIITFKCRTARFMMTQSDHYQFRIEKVAKVNQRVNREDYEDDEEEVRNEKIPSNKVPYSFLCIYASKIKETCKMNTYNCLTHPRFLSIGLDTKKNYLEI